MMSSQDVYSFLHKAKAWTDQKSSLWEKNPNYEEVAENYEEVAKNYKNNSSLPHQ